MRSLRVLLVGIIVSLLLVGCPPNTFSYTLSDDYGGTATAPVRITALISPQPAKVLNFLQLLQDSASSGLVPVSEGSDISTTYTSAMAAIAFVSAGEFERARKVFDAFPALGDPCATCQCPGGFQQFRLASTGGPDPSFDPNDFWIGDNAWLLIALKYYRRQTGDSRYDVLIDHLKDWFVCIQKNTPPPGIYAGYTKDGKVKAEKHPEGSIDVVGALDGPDNVDATRRSIRDWLDKKVWVPTSTCFDPGPKIKDNAPTDVIAWGFLSLGPNYRCILSYAEKLTARRQDRYTIEKCDRDGYWQIAKQIPDIGVSLRCESNQLVVQYSFPAGAEWFRVFRQRDIDLDVTSQFHYIFELNGDGSRRQFEAKLAKHNKKLGDRVYVYYITLDFVGWRQFDIPYDRFQDFTPGNQPLRRIQLIEFALNSKGISGDGEFRVRDVRYTDSGAPFLRPVKGFDGFQSEINWLFPEGTGQMSTAYCAAGKSNKATKYLRQLKRLLVPAFGGEAKGLPAITTGGINRPVPVAAASAWYFVAKQCLNPVSG